MTPKTVRDVKHLDSKTVITMSGCVVDYNDFRKHMHCKVLEELGLVVIIEELKEVE